MQSFFATTTPTGNANTATKLATAVNIGGVSFDGSAAIDLAGVNSAGNQDTTGNANTATKLATAVNIGGVSFDGSAAIDLAGVNSAGNQDTTGNADTATSATSLLTGGTDIAFQPNGNTKMTLTTAGNLGIGTTNPLCPLHVATAETDTITHTSTGFGGRRISKFLVGSANLATNSSTSSTQDLSIYASKSIYTSQNFAAIGGSIAIGSDSRIKTNIEDLEDSACLEQLNQLKPKRYEYKDVVQRGDVPVVGFIAQEVKEVIPSAVILMAEYTPNIYQVGTLNEGVLEFATPLDLTHSGKVKVFDIQDREHFLDVASASDTSITLTDATQITEEMLYENKLFVYGEKVSDFHFLKKEMIIPIMTGGIQELDRIRINQSEKLMELEQRLAALEH